MQLAVFHFGECSDRHLAASTKAVEQRALAGRSCAGIGIVQESEQFASLRVAFMDLDAQRTLPCRWTHDFGWNDLLDRFCLAKSLQSGRSEDDRVVFSLLELAKTCIDVPA